MTGSHIDTVRTGGRYDGNLGVLAGLEVVATLDAAGVATRRPLVVAFFTNEEGARFAPDMLGSLVYAGGLPLEEALAAVAIDGKVLGAELDAHRVCRRGAGAPLSSACVRRAPHRAGPGARRRRHHHRRRRRPAGHLVAGDRDHRPIQSRRHDADAPAARRRLLRRGDRHLPAAARARDGRRPGLHGGQDRARAQPHQRDRRPRHAHRRPAQHRRVAAAGGRATPRRVPRNARPRRGRDDPHQATRPLRAR